jgi:hypothetical protein
MNQSAVFKPVILHLKYKFIIMPLLNILTLFLNIAVNIVIFCIHCFYNLIGEPYSNVHKCVNASTVQYVALQTPESLKKLIIY